MTAERRSIADGSMQPISSASIYKAGGRMILAELEPSPLDWLIPGLEIISSPARALFRPDENHPIFAGFAAEDFRLWDYLPVREPVLRGPVQPYAGKRTRDLVECPIRFGGKEFDRIAHIRRDDRVQAYSIADADREASSLLEIVWGKGRLLISQARLFERFFSHPLAKILFHREIEYLANADAGETASREKFDVILRF